MSRVDLDELAQGVLWRLRRTGHVGLTVRELVDILRVDQRSVDAALAQLRTRGQVASRPTGRGTVYRTTQHEWGA